MTSAAFFDWLDEQPRSTTGVLVRMPQGEMRSVSIASLAQDFEQCTRRIVRRPRLERRSHELAIFTHLIEKENQ